MKREPRRLYGLIVGGVLSILALTLVGAWVALVVPLRSKRDRLSRELDESARDFHAQTWRRPVLRGEPLPGDAFAAQRAALETLAVRYPAASGERLRDEREAGGPFSEETAADVSDWQESLTALRDSTRREHAWADWPAEEGPSAPEQSLLPQIHASRLLLAAATLGEPDECLRIGADVIRIGQDLAAGNGLVGLMVHHAIATMAFESTRTCVGRAGRGALRAAERELTILSRYPAATGHALEAEAIFLGGSLAMDADIVDVFPTRSAAFEMWWHAPELLEAWELLMGEPAARRSYGRDYPTDIVRFETWAAAVEAHGNPLVGVGGASMSVRYLRRDAATRSAVRLLLAGVKLQLAAEDLGTEAPGWLRSPALLDPRTGRPFAWEASAPTFTLRSIDPFGGADQLDFEVSVTRAEPEPEPSAER